ncbi:TraK domain-containing protein [Candidatus Protochlamydia naegleriophila]|nr:type-F conjugative transfer system secretin TraK [Candidatus Protochlamydia naegleriophila]
MNLKFLFTVALSSIFRMCSIEATLSYDLDTTKLLRCSFSIDHHNRIMIQNGRVRKIIYPEENLSISLEEHSGQAFIYAVGKIEKPLALALITESGLVQDIELSFQNKESEVLILNEAQEEETKDALPSCIAPYMTEEEQRQLLVNDILSGRIPDGYVSCTQPRWNRSIKCGLQGTNIVKLENTTSTIYIYEIVNSSKKKRKISEADLKCEGSTWICLESHTLKPREKILGIVCVGKP